MLNDGAEMVRRDGISDGDVGAGEVGMELVEILAEPVQRAVIEGEIRRVEADVEDAIRLTGHGARDLSKGTQQIMDVAGMGVVRDEPIGQPGLRIVRGELDRIGDELGLQLRRRLRFSQAA